MKEYIEKREIGNMNSKNFQKTSKKVLTIRGEACIIHQVAASKGNT